MNWSKYDLNDKDTWPLSRGQYLIKYDDGTGLLYYMICYYWNEGNKIGFYYDEDCKEEDTIYNKWNYSVKEYMFLPNLFSKNGEYQ